MVNKTKTKVARVKSKKFKLSLDFGDLHYQAKGDSVIEAMENLKVDRFHIQGFGIFTLESGKKKAELKYTPFLIRRLLVNRTSRELFQKRILLNLK